MRLEGLLIGFMLGVCAVLGAERLFKSVPTSTEVRTGACCEEYLQHIADHHPAKAADE